MCWGGLGGVWKVFGSCLGCGDWDVLEVFRCVRVLFGVCFGSFWFVRSCLGAGSRGIGARSVDMGWSVHFGTDLACESPGLRGKDRL